VVLYYGMEMVQVTPYTSNTTEENYVVSSR